MTTDNLQDMNNAASTITLLSVLGLPPKQKHANSRGVGIAVPPDVPHPEMWGGGGGLTCLPRPSNFPKRNGEWV